MTETLLPSQPSSRYVHGFWYFVLWLGGVICLPAFMLGITVIGEVSFSDFLIAMLAGQIILGSCIAASGWVGTRRRQNAATLIAESFGPSSFLIKILIALAVCCWFAFQLEIFAQSFVALMMHFYHIELPLFSVIILSGVIMSISAIIGFRALDWLCRLTVPIILGLFLWPLFNLSAAHQLAEIWAHAPKGDLTIPHIMGLFVGGVATGILVAPDFTRYVQTPRQTIFWAYASNLLASPVIYILAAILGIWAAPQNATDILMVFAGGFSALIFLFFATWTTNDNNLFVAINSLSSFLPKTSHLTLALLVAAFSIAIALAGIVNHFLAFLSLLGFVFAAIGAVFLADQFARHWQKAILPPALLWLAVLGSFLALRLPLSRIPVLDIMIMGLLLYLLLSFFCKKLPSFCSFFRKIPGFRAAP